MYHRDLECFVRKIDECLNNPEISSSSKTGDHILCGYSKSTIWGFAHIKDKHTLYRGKGCKKNLGKSFKEHAQRIIGFEKTKTLPLTN